MSNESLLEPFLAPYTIIHLPLVIGICLFGIVANVLNVIVLTRRPMRAQPINIILTGLSTAQLLLLVNFICYTAYSRLFDAPCAVAAKSLVWLSYLLLNVNLNLVLHTIALVHTSLLAIIRYLVVHFPNRHIITLFRIKMTVALCWVFVPLLCASFYTNSHVAPLNLSRQCADWKPGWDTYKLSYSNNHRQMAFNFWLFAIACKVLPCLCLTVLSLLLVRDMKKAQLRRVMLRKSSTRGDHYLKVDRQHLSVTVMLLTIVALFIIVELPQGLLNVLQALASQGIIFRNFDYTAHIYLPLGMHFHQIAVRTYRFRAFVFINLQLRVRERINEEKRFRGLFRNAHCTLQRYQLCALLRHERPLSRHLQIDVSYRNTVGASTRRIRQIAVDNSC